MVGVAVAKSQSFRISVKSSKACSEIGSLASQLSGVKISTTHFQKMAPLPISAPLRPSLQPVARKFLLFFLHQCVCFRTKIKRFVGFMFLGKSFSFCPLCVCLCLIYLFVLIALAYFALMLLYLVIENGQRYALFKASKALHINYIGLQETHYQEETETLSSLTIHVYIFVTNFSHIHLYVCVTSYISMLRCYLVYLTRCSIYKTQSGLLLLCFIDV